MPAIGRFSWSRKIFWIFTLVLVLWSVAFYSRALEYLSQISTGSKQEAKPWLESYAFVGLNNATQGRDSGATFFVILPYSVDNNTKILRQLKAKDKISLFNLKVFLHSMTGFDGATCLQHSAQHERNHEHDKNTTAEKPSYQSSWCSLMKRNWSVNIRNTGPLRKVLLLKTLASGSNIPLANSGREAPIEFQVCNIAQGPFVIRKDVFEKIGGLHDSFGKVTLLEFFLRTGGKLKIAKLANCAWSSEITRMDRGNLEGTKFFTEYTTLGNKHKILRIVLPRRIEWTSCLVNWKYCREEPYVKPKGLPAIALPICCNAVLDKMLTDMVWAFEKLNLDYRVVFGTLLGAVRSKSIIPWTYDIDLALSRSVFRNQSTYEALEQVLNNKYYVGRSVRMPRAHMHGPPYIEVDTGRFFDGPNDLHGNALFGIEFDEAVKGMLPISTHWRHTSYVDFYKGRSDWMNSTSFVTINGRNYSTVKDVNGFLKYWYGDKFLEPSHKGKWVGFSNS